MALPQSIQRQLDAADSLLAQAKAPVPETPPTPEPQPTPTPVEPAAETPSPEVAPSPPPVPEETWQHKYKTLQGLHNVQSTQMRELKERQRQADLRAQEMGQELERLKQPVEKPGVTDPKDVETFGADLVAMVARVVDRKIDSIAGVLDAKLKSVDERLSGTAQVVAKSAEEVFFERLTAAVPDWEALNSDNEFLLWLTEVDPVYGMPRQNALDAAHHELNATRTANVFLAFKAGKTPVAAPAPAPTAASKLEKQVSPNTASVSAPAPAQKPKWSQAQIVAFYDDVAKGRFRGREAEAAQIEVSLNQALAEGRVT